MAIRICEMPRAEYAGLTYTAVYTTELYYAVNVSENGFLLEERSADPPLKKSFSDALFGDWLEAPVAFGAFDDEELLGFVEGSPESWHRLFRVSNVFIYPQHRRKGVAKALLCHIIGHARQQAVCRGVILETQTSNYAAISLYKKLGFRLTRIDLNEYTNTDVENNEVRIDLLMKFE